MNDYESVNDQQGKIRGGEGLWRKMLSLEFKKQAEIQKTSSGLCQLMKSFQIKFYSHQKKRDIYQENIIKKIKGVSCLAKGNSLSIIFLGDICWAYLSVLI